MQFREICGICVRLCSEAAVEHLWDLTSGAQSCESGICVMLGLPLGEEEFFETFVAGVDGGDVANAVEEAHEGGRHFYRLANGSLYR